MTLANIPPGVSFKVLKVRLNKEIGKRLADMGFVSGVRGYIVRAGVLGGPLQVHIMGYEVVIRRFEASGIEVES
ncbi:MAG: ferrous iron transport protein A [Spirochaetaceae bacterium]|jgi:Fe2+ transport system protein FeoA|nr:ferrous iron transport protein A [Spirochaetaceae bacterium]